MALEVTYAWYAETYQGSLEAQAFQAALPRAESRVRARCAAHDLDALEEPEATAYRRAVCSACDAMSDPAVSSWKSGSASVEYVDAAANSTDSVIERELSGTRLASCWV